MEYKTLSPINVKKSYDDLIFKILTQWMYNDIFKPAIELLKEDTVINANDILLNAIRAGLIYYQDGAFYSTRGRFSNAISLELEKLGAKYSKYRKAYLIDIKKIPMELLGSIEMINASTGLKVIALQQLFNNLISSIDLKGVKLDLNEAINTILLDLQDRTLKNFQNHKIQTIAPKFDDFRASEFAKKYTDNMEFWVNDWAETDISKMRDVVGQMAIEGKSLKTIEEYIRVQFKVSQRKAKFLARNENSLAVASYLTAKYQQEGFTSYKWVSSNDERVRELHKELNGQIFRFDNPPVAYRYTYKTGAKKGQTIEQRGNPSQTYNCRCVAVPIVTKEFWETRKIK